MNSIIFTIDFVFGQSSFVLSYFALEMHRRTFADDKTVRHYETLNDGRFVENKNNLLHFLNKVFVMNRRSTRKWRFLLGFDIEIELKWFNS